MDARPPYPAWGPRSFDPQFPPAHHAGTSPGRLLAVSTVLLMLSVTAVFGLYIFERSEYDNRIREGVRIDIDADVAMTGQVRIIIDRWKPAEKLVYNGTFGINSYGDQVTVALGRGNHTMFVDASFAYLSKNSYPSEFEVFPDRITELKVHIVAGS
jgi:hypothetical protein